MGKISSFFANPSCSDPFKETMTYVGELMLNQSIKGWTINPQPPSNNVGQVETPPIPIHEKMRLLSLKMEALRHVLPKGTIYKLEAEMKKEIRRFFKEVMCTIGKKTIQEPLPIENDAPTKKLPKQQNSEIKLDSSFFEQDS